MLYKHGSSVELSLLALGSTGSQLLGLVRQGGALGGKMAMRLLADCSEERGTGLDSDSSQHRDRVSRVCLNITVMLKTRHQRESALLTEMQIRTRDAKHLAELYSEH